MKICDEPDLQIAGLRWRVTADPVTDVISIEASKGFGSFLSTIKSSRPFSSMPIGLDAEVHAQIEEEMEAMIKRFFLE